MYSRVLKIHKHSHLVKLALTVSVKETKTSWKTKYSQIMLHIKSIQNHRLKSCSVHNILLWGGSPPSTESEASLCISKWTSTCLNCLRGHNYRGSLCRFPELISYLQIIGTETTAVKWKNLSNIEFNLLMFWSSSTLECSGLLLKQ